MTERDAPIWYDGATRGRQEAIDRIERDALAFLARAVSDFEANDSAWLLLLEGLDVPRDLDEPEEGTFSRAYSIRVSDDRVIVYLSDRLPRQLQATFTALAKQPWCFAPQLRKGAIEMQVRKLDPTHQARIESYISLEARAVCDAMRRGIAALVSIAAPSPLPRVASALDGALQKVEAVSTAKIERRRSSGETA